jgi:hypothetical protein
MDFNLNWHYYNINIDFINTFYKSDFDFKTFHAFWRKTYFDSKKRKTKPLFDNPKEEKTRFGLSRECLQGKKTIFLRS